jgi:hypothetical protein
MEKILIKKEEFFQFVRISTRLCGFFQPKESVELGKSKEKSRFELLFCFSFICFVSEITITFLTSELLFFTFNSFLLLVLFRFSRFYFQKTSLSTSAFFCFFSLPTVLFHYFIKTWCFLFPPLRFHILLPFLHSSL